MAFAERHVVVTRRDAEICRTDDLAVLRKLLETVRTPAADAGNGEKRRVELFWQIEHVIHKAAVVVNVGADAFVDLALFGDHAAGDLFDFHVEIAFFFAAFFLRKRAHKATQHSGAGIALGIHSVSHAIDQTGAVKGALVKDGCQIFFDLFVVGPVGDAAFEIVKHVAHTDVGTAVARSLERAERAGDSRVGVRASGGDDARGERRVVAAAVIRMEDETEIEQLGFELAEIFVRADQIENGFRMGKALDRIVQDEAVVVVVVVINAIGVRSDDRQAADQLQTLAHDIWQADIVGAFVVGVEREHRARESVHHIVGWRFHDDIAHKTVWQRAVVVHLLNEKVQLRGAWQFASEQEIGDLFKAVALVVDDATHKLLHVVAAIEQLTVAGHRIAVGVLFVGVDISNVRQPGDDTAPGDVAQAALDIVLAVELRIDVGIAFEFFCQGVDARRDSAIIVLIHCNTSFGCGWFCIYSTLIF